MNKFITVYNYEADILLSEHTTRALFEDNFLTFHTDNDTITINLEKETLTKTNNESIFKINTENCTLTLLELNKTFNLKILTFNFNLNPDLEIIYQLESQEKPFKILIKIGSDIDGQN